MLIINMKHKFSYDVDENRGHFLRVFILLFMLVFSAVINAFSLLNAISIGELIVRTQSMLGYF